MIREIDGIRRKGLTCLALGMLCLLPTSSQAESVTFTNDTKATLVVQLVTTVQGVVRRDRPHQLCPGGTVSVALPGNKLVNIYDARLPSRVLYQSPLPSSSNDLFFSIRPDPRILSRVILELARPTANSSP